VEWKKRKILIGSLILFALTRLFISLFYSRYISDLEVFHYSALQSLNLGARAYRDYFFPYPPLSLLLTNWPVWISHAFPTYRALFHMSFFVVELSLVLASLRLGRRVLLLTDRQLSAFVLLYAGLGFLQGHLLYDRLDLGIALLLVLSALAFQPERRVRSFLIWNLGFLMKFMPLFWAPYSLLLSPSAPGRTFLRRTLAAAGAFALTFVPSLGVLAVFAWWSDGALVHSLGEHGARTIQIESTWASGFFVLKQIFPAMELNLISKWGAQHIAPESIPAVVNFLSRYLGWMLWLGSLVACAVKAPRLRELSRARLGVFHFQTLVTFVVGFMATQRVLSPQYFLWVMAPLALLCVAKRSWHLRLVVPAMYVLTYIGFDLRYYALVNLDPATILIVAARNALLLVLFAYLIRSLVRFNARKPI